LNIKVDPAISPSSAVADVDAVVILFNRQPGAAVGDQLQPFSLVRTLLLIAIILGICCSFHDDFLPRIAFHRDTTAQETYLEEDGSGRIRQRYRHFVTVRLLTVRQGEEQQAGTEYGKQYRFRFHMLPFNDTPTVIMSVSLF
jgi:hypothetical protein